MPSGRQKHQAPSTSDPLVAKSDFERFVRSMTANDWQPPNGQNGSSLGASNNASCNSNGPSTGSAKGGKSSAASAVAAATAMATSALSSPTSSASVGATGPSTGNNAAAAAGPGAAGAAGRLLSSGTGRHSVSPHWDDQAPHDTYDNERDWRWLKLLVPAKNFVTCYVLVPGILGECGSEHVCIPWLNLLVLIIDVVVFSSHLVLAMKSPSYRKSLPTRNFYLVVVVWSLYNVASHPVTRQNVIDFFSVAPPEIHLTTNLLATFVCAATGLFPTLSLARLLCLLLGQLLLSLFLSFADLLAFHVSSGFLSAVRLDIVMFNVAILLVGATIIIGSMTIEKDFKSLTHDADSRFPHSNAFEEDLERRKRAVLTALCDAVFTTDAAFVVTGSEEGADKIFRRSMLNENLTHYFKDRIERDHFMAAVRKQFPENGVSGDGPKRMRAIFRDARRETFESDVVISDASTDENGKVKRYMIGMHIRSGEKLKALGDRRRSASGLNGSAALKGSPVNSGKTPATKGGRPREGPQMYDVLAQELFRCCDGYLRLPEEPPYLKLEGESLGGAGPDGPALQSSSDSASNGNGIGSSNVWAQSTPAVASESNGSHAAATSSSAEPGPADGEAQAVYQLRRANCEVYRKKVLQGHGGGQPRLGGGRGPPQDLKRLALPENSPLGFG